MQQHTRTGRWPLRLVATAVAVAVALGGAPVADARTQDHPVTDWARDHAGRISTETIGRASVVGLGESVHGTAQETTLKFRVLRLLVQQMGFRSLAWEEDWTLGRRLDAYIRGGQGDLDALMSRMSGQWQTREVRRVLSWLRRYNADHAVDVRFTGVEFYVTPPQAYRDVVRHVARTAPRRLPALRQHVREIRPFTSNMYAYIGWFEKHKHQQRFVRHARQVYALVSDLSHRPGDRGHAKTLHTARQILSFYQHYSLGNGESPAYRDAHAAANLRWWRSFSGDKVAYWAASPHTANAPRLRITMPPDPRLRFASAGSYLRRWYGPRYLSIGFTLDHGRVTVEPGETEVLPPPRKDWFEQPLGGTGLDQFALDLRTPVPPSVQRWLDDRVTTRGLPGRGPDSTVSGGTLAQWFDVIVHRQQVTPSRPLRR